MYTLHPLTPADRHEIESVYAASIRANPQGFIQDLSRQGSIFDQFSRFIEQGGAAVVLKQNKKDIVGMGALRVMDNTTAELCKLHLKADLQGQGLGKYMVLSLLARAQELGFKTIDLHVTATQAPAIGLYKRLGFTVYHQEDCHVDINGKTEVYDTIFMKKALL